MAEKLAPTMPNRHRIFILAALLLVVVLLFIGIRLTGNPDQSASARRRNRSAQEQQAWTSQRSLDTARELAKTANTRDEDRLARQATQVADHDLDLAFTTALREAQLHPTPPSPETKQLRARVAESDAQIKADQTHVLQLTTAINAAKAADVDQLQQQLDLTEAELTLHAEELEDAKQDLARTTDDAETRIQRMLDAHKNSQHPPADATQQQAAPVRLPAFQLPGSMFEQLKMLKSLNDRQKTLLSAQQSALALSQEIDRRHDDMEKSMSQPAPTSSDVAPKPMNRAQIAALDEQSQNRKLLTDYDRRQQDQQELAQVYGNWATLLGTRETACLHGLLIGLLWILVVFICVVLAEMVLEKFLLRTKGDRRRSATIRLLVRFGLRFVGIMLVLFIFFGKPSELTTILGLAGAGLTVALKDFIVSFFGWFVLMGKNGIRIGDWVEINGISGEVVEVGLLRTVLLETGNWTDSGHPTGRRVAFVNSFAIEGHYFNFSTTGQWLWDSLEILVPATDDPFPIADAVLQVVQQQTDANVQVAEKEWQHTTHKYGVQSLAAAPSIELRPAATGVNIIVRYITRAHERFGVRTKLYQTIVELLHHRNIDPAQALPGGENTTVAKS